MLASDGLTLWMTLKWVARCCVTLKNGEDNMVATKLSVLWVLPISMQRVCSLRVLTNCQPWPRSTTILTTPNILNIMVMYEKLTGWNVKSTFPWRGMKPNKSAISRWHVAWANVWISKCVSLRMSRNLSRAGMSTKSLMWWTKPMHRSLDLASSPASKSTNMPMNIWNCSICAYLPSLRMLTVNP